MEVEDCGGGVILIAWQFKTKTLNQQKEGCLNKSLSPKESATLPPLRLEEVTSHQQVLRRQEALVRDHHQEEGHPVEGRVPRRRRGRRGQDQVRAHIQHQVVTGRQLEVSMLRARR